VRPVHHEVDGIAAQAVAVSHDLATGSMRSDTDMLSASAQEVASSVRRLQIERPLWAPPSGPITILDPVSGIAVRLAHMRLDGTLALEEGPSRRPTRRPLSRNSRRRLVTKLAPSPRATSPSRLTVPCSTSSPASTMCRFRPRQRRLQQRTSLGECAPYPMRSA
jgi:hypothetical protein